MNKLAVVIGRFQVARLHEGHKQLLNYAKQDGDQLLVILGSSKAEKSNRNPLSFTDRKIMIHELYPTAIVLEQEDHPSDEIWSENLDKLINENFPNFKISLFGSRDSFSTWYHGVHPVILIPCVMEISGTSERAKNSTPKCQESFRLGKVASSNERFPTSFQCVDIALVRHEDQKILLGRKSTDKSDTYRLPGGFVDPHDNSLENAASRELSEEVLGIMTHEFKYLGSFRSKDFRYQSEPNKIMTALFLTYHMGGLGRAGDDLCEVQWFTIAEAVKVIIPDHSMLLERVIEELSSPETSNPKRNTQ